MQKARVTENAKSKDGRQDIPFIRGNDSGLLELLQQVPRGARRTDECGKSHLHAMRGGNDPFSLGKQILTRKTLSKNMARKTQNSIRHTWHFH
jgi:hypothetical protein